MEKDYDSKLISIEQLKWLPFIGEKYAQQEKKILLIGESHYHNEDNTSGTINTEVFTRAIVKELGQGFKDYKDNSNFFKNINSMFAKNNNIDFWENVSFYNFIQRNMNKNKNINERPNKADFIAGWDSFFKVIEILNPNYCLFFGNSAADYFNESAIKNNKNLNPIVRSEKVGRSYLKHGGIEITENKLVELYFIKHPSSYFSKEKWTAALTKQNSDLVNSLSFNK